MWKKSIIILIAILIALSSYILFSFLGSSEAIPDEITITENTQDIQDDSDTKKPDSTQEEDNLTEDDEDDYEGSSRAYYITDEDCDNKCEDFDENTSQWRYCAEICAIIPIESPTTECEEKTGLSQDYCYRDKAVSNKDLDACKNIQDRGIYEQCHQRITELMIDDL